MASSLSAFLGEIGRHQLLTPEQELTREALHDDLEALLEELTSREAAVIRLRYGLEDDTPQTLSQIGEDLHLSRERVRQIESRALLKLRQPQRRGQRDEQRRPRHWREGHRQDSSSSFWSSAR